MFNNCNIHTWLKEQNLSHLLSLVGGHWQLTVLAECSFQNNTGNQIVNLRINSYQLVFTAPLLLEKLLHFAV